MRISVIGLGLIGASIAKALSGKTRITGIDNNPEVIDQALAQGVITEGGPNLSLARGSDLVVIAVPVGSITDVAKKLIPHLDAGTVITDTGSTKEQIVACLDGLWPDFIGSHPIAGKENPGYQASQADLFSGKVVIITPSEATKGSNREKAARLWESCGARVIDMDPITHDRLMAIISHMPHLLSFTSMGIAKDLHIHRDLLGAGFRDFTRIAASDPVMWRDIFLANKPHILRLIDDYLRELSSMKELIASDESATLEDKLRMYSTIRRELYDNTR